MLLAWAGNKFVVVVCPGFVIVIDGRHIGVVKNVEKLMGPATGLECQFPVFQPPSAFIDVLVLPLAGITDTGFALHVVEPHVFGTLAVGPHILTGYATGVATDTLVQVQHHCQLGFNLHTSPPPPPYEPRSSRPFENRQDRSS